MKKLLFLSFTLLLLTGCVPAQQRSTEQADVVDLIPIEEEIGDSASDEAAGEEETTEGEIGIDATDLNDLAAEINAMETEDLSGFSN